MSVGSRAINVIVQVGSTMCLARLLSPDDFGLVAMVAAITGFAPMLVDLGTRDAAVQKSQITEEEVSALFWLTVGLGLGLGILLALCSPLIASFYHESRLQRIAIVSSLTFVLSAASCQHFALLRRAMMFQKIAILEVGSNLFSAVCAVAMAFSGAGYWALVAKPILGSFFTVVGVWICCRWLPGLPKLTAGVKEMVKFGLNITGFTMTDYAGRAADRIGLGAKVGARPLGHYQNALFVYDNTLGLLSVSLHSVAVASLSKLRDNLPELRRAWANALSTVAFFGMPVFALMAVTGQDFMVVLLGEKWVHAGTLVSLLALRGMPHVVERTLGWLHVSAGRADRWMRWGLVSSAVQIAALLCGLPFGTKGVAIAYAICMYILFVPALVYAGQPLGIRARDVIRVVGAPLVGSLVTTAVGFLLRYSVLAEMPKIGRIAIMILLCGACYLLIVVWLFKITKPLQVARSLGRDFLPKRFHRFVGLGFERAPKKVEERPVATQ